MVSLTLNIDALEQTGWRAAWLLDRQPTGQPFSLSGPSAASITDLSRRFLALFESGARPVIEHESLRAIGRMLFERWFEPVWKGIEPHLVASSYELLIRSNDRHVLNLPWELVELHPDLPLGCDAAWSLRRTSLAQLAPSDGTLDPGPLRVLFLAAAPIDQHQIDYEREEDAMLRATGRLEQSVVVHFAETGTFAELGELVLKCRPHMVHLSGHGMVNADGTGTFAFEDERGLTDSRDAAEIVADVFRGSSVRCVFWNGCQTAQAAVAGLCQALTRADLPLAIGWSASVADTMATEFAEVLYRRLVSGEAVPTAAAHARVAIRRSGRIPHAAGMLQDATFALPQVYCSAAGGDLFDRAAPPVSYAGPRTEYALLGDGIKGLREGFVGRRREVQKMLPALRDGQTTFAVITGLGGAGKSTLATRAANRLAAAGYRVLPVRTAPGDSPAQCGRATLVKLVDALERAFVAETRDDLHALLSDGKLPLDQRLRLAVDALAELRLVIVLDNFEDVLELQTRRIAGTELSGLYQYLVANLTRGSRVIVTCRYMPLDTPDVATMLHVPLPDLEQHDFIKFLRRDSQVDSRIRRGELPAKLLFDLHEKLGGTPGFLEYVRRVLRTAEPDKLESDLAGDVPGQISTAREQYFQRIFATRLYEVLSPEARHLASCLALSELPLPIDAVAAITGLEPPRAASTIESCVAYGVVHAFADQDLPSLHHPPGLLRSWLSALERLPQSDARNVHARLAVFWRESYESDREAELRVPVDVELAVCRHHAAIVTDRALYQWATVRLAQRLDHRAEWRAARELLAEIPDAERTGECLLTLASVEESLGEWRAARNYLERALVLVPHASREKAATWHQLATIDVNEGNYAAAREKFGKSLQMRQAIGDRAGEAATFHQLGFLAHRMGRTHEAVRLVAICWLIDQAIGHGDAVSDLRAVLALCEEIGYGEEQIKEMLREAAEAYQADRGVTLIARAFESGGDGPSSLS